MSGKLVEEMARAILPNIITSNILPEHNEAARIAIARACLVHAFPAIRDMCARVADECRHAKGEQIEPLIRALSLDDLTKEPRA